MRILRFLIVVLVLSVGGRAQESDRSMAISISPISLPFGSVDILFQYNVARFLTLTLPAHFSYFWPLPVAVDIVSEKGQRVETSRAPISVGGGLGARFYPTGKGMTNGFFLEPRVSISYDQVGIQSRQFGKIEWDFTQITPMLRFGWDWFYDSGFYSSFGAGIGYSFYTNANIRIPASEIQNFMRIASYFVSYIPNPDSKSNIAWDLEYKIGFAW